MPSASTESSATPPHGKPSPDFSWAVDTAVVHLGRPPTLPGEPLNLAITPASAYVAGGEVEYARDGTTAMMAVEQTVGVLEGGHGVVYSTGMAAASAVLDGLVVGAIVVAPPHLYTGVAVRLRQLNQEGRITLRPLMDSTGEVDVTQFTGAHLVWMETPSNPMLDIIDIAAVTQLAHDAGAQVLCDNTFATPIGQNPLALGADYVLHSATKSLGGHSDLMAGVVVTAQPVAAERLREQRVLLGSVPGALECFLLLRGIRTLTLRYERAHTSAQLLAERLAEHHGVTKVHYPGLPDHPGHDIAQRQMKGFAALISIDLGTAERATALCESTKLWIHSTSLGGVESLLERRRRWAKESPLVPDSLVRLAVGIENAEDLWSDLDQALRSLTPTPS